MKVIAIVPARMGSTRFPGKPMAKIMGMPMIGHCFKRSKLCSTLDEVYVATCDKEIYDYITSIGGKAVMTKDTHERASDRAAEALLKIEAETGIQQDIVVMIQGDEPLFVPQSINDLVNSLVNADAAVPIANLIEEIPDIKDQESPNTVKVVMDKNDFALYLSREPIPSQKKTSELVKRYKQLGIIAFRRQMLLDFNDLAPMPLEEIESVDMNRVLEHGHKIKLIKTAFQTDAVDTPGDLVRVNTVMADDPFFPRYSSIYAN